jgi:hypothetical protein
VRWLSSPVESRRAVLLAVLGTALGVHPAAAQSTDTSPSGMVAFFMSSGATCPTGWTAAALAQGRLIVGVSSTSTVGMKVGSPLASQTAPTHQHAFAATVPVSSRHISASHCCNNQGARNGGYLTTGTTVAGTSNLPLIQLVVCQKN